MDLEKDERKVQKELNGGYIEIEIDKWAEISKLAYEALLPRLLHVQGDESYETSKANIFKEGAKKAHSSLSTILTILKDIKNTKAAMRKHFIPIFLLLGEQEDSSNGWSCCDNETLVSDIICELYRILELEMSEPGPLSTFFTRDFDTIMHPNKTIFAHILKTFRDSLGQKHAPWKQYPAAVASFQWIIFQIPFPHMTSHLEGVLLPTLNMFDDFESRNTLQGLKCLSYIVDNVLKSELRQSGWGLVIRQQLLKATAVQKDPEVLDAIFPQILKILKIIEEDPHKNAEKFTLYDKTLAELLSTVEMSDALTRTIWIKNLTIYIDVMGLATLHYIERIIRLLKDSTISADPDRWMVVLKCAKMCILNTWVRPQSEDFAEIVLRIIFNIVTLNMHNSPTASTSAFIHEIKVAAHECMRNLVFNSDFKKVQDQLEDMARTGCGNLNPDFIKAWAKLYRTPQDTQNS